MKKSLSFLAIAAAATVLLSLPSAAKAQVSIRGPHGSFSIGGGPFVPEVGAYVPDPYAEEIYEGDDGYGFYYNDAWVPCERYGTRWVIVQSYGRGYGYARPYAYGRSYGYARPYGYGGYARPYGGYGRGDGFASRRGFEGRREFQGRGGFSGQSRSQFQGQGRSQGRSQFQGQGRSQFQGQGQGRSQVQGRQDRGSRGNGNRQDRDSRRGSDGRQ
jgi:hypothetical protein